MKLTKSFWLVLAVMIVLFVLPTIDTYNSPMVDGPRVFGFPLRFYSYGGLCSTSPCRSFNYWNLLLDIFVLVGIPLTANFISIKSSSKYFEKNKTISLIKNDSRTNK
jgi:hypothetical protein